MTSYLNNNHVSNNELLSEEQMMFPYLVTLDSDIELMKRSDEPVLEPVKAHDVLAIKGTAETTQTNSITEKAATVTDTPILENTNTESTQGTDETLNLLCKQLADAQKDITMLRDCIRQSQFRFLDFGIRMLKMENTIEQLKLQQSIAQGTNSYVNNSALPEIQTGIPTGKDAETTVTNATGNLGENPDTDFTQPPAKRAKITRTKRVYKGVKPLCTLCDRHHHGPCVKPCERCDVYGHQEQNCKFPPKGINPKALKVCFKCGNTGHVKNNCPLQMIEDGEERPHVGTSTKQCRKSAPNLNRTRGTCQYDNLNFCTVLYC